VGGGVPKFARFSVFNREKGGLFCGRLSSARDRLIAQVSLELNYY